VPLSRPPNRRRQPRNRRSNAAARSGERHRPAARAAGDSQQRADFAAKGARAGRGRPARVLPRPAGSIVYELTDYGSELEEALIRFGRWGARSLGEPRLDEIITPDSMVMALRSTFRAEAAEGVRASYELRLGDVTVSVRMRDGTVEAAAEPLPGADLVIEAGPGIRALMAGEITPAAAIEDGVVRVDGKRRLFEQFAEMFRI
jgi:putative sterol carrier protein